MSAIDLFFISRFHHLVESVDVTENVAVTDDYIAEFDQENVGVVRLHSTP
jgi:hypothetical protein